MSHDPYEDLVGLEVEVVENSGEISRGKLMSRSYSYITVGERLLSRVIITRKNIRSLRCIGDGK